MAGSLSAWKHLDWLLSEQGILGEEGQAASVSEDGGSGVTHRLLPHSALWSCMPPLEEKSVTKIFAEILKILRQDLESLR